MKKVKENIYEKFSDYSDPIRDMGIGIEHEVEKFVRSKFKPGVKEVTDPWYKMFVCVDWQKPEFVQYLLSRYYYPKEKIWDFIRHNQQKKPPNQEVLKLLNDYYQKLDEKFIEKSDPIRDMSIGLHQLWNKVNQQWHSPEKSCDEIYDKFLRNLIGPKYRELSVYLVRIPYHTIKKLQENPDLIPQESFELTCSEEMRGNEPKYGKKLIRKLSSYILENVFKLDVDPYIIDESLNEKFKETSDPLEDLSIGVKHEYEKWLDEFKASPRGLSWNLNIPNSQLMAVGDQGKTEFVDYLINKLGANPNFDNVAALRCAAYQENFETGVELVKHGADLRKAIKHADYWNHKDTVLALTKIEDMIKGSLNEKFEETTDPIEDLGVGNKKKFEDAFKEFVRNAMKGFWSSISKVETIKDSIIFNISHDPYNDNFSNNRYHAMIVSGLDKYVKRVVHHRRSQFTDEYMFEFKPEYQYLIEGIKSIQYKKTFLKGRFIKNQQMYTYEAEIIWKDVNEKFRAESDPIQDMNIGTREVWKNLKPGDVLKVVNWVNASHPDDSIVKITHITPLNPDQMIINYENFYNEKDFLKKDKKGGIVTHGWTITYDFFKNNLQLVSHLRERFTPESDPIKDMRIGIDEIVKQFEKDLEKEKGGIFGWGNDFQYYPREGFIRITTTNLSEIGVISLQKNLDKVLSKYPGIFKITRKPGYKTHGRYGLTHNRDAIIRVMNK